MTTKFLFKFSTRVRTVFFLFIASLFIFSYPPYFEIRRSRTLVSEHFLPPPLSSIYSLSPTSPRAAYHLKHDFSQPLVLTTYVRPSSLPEGMFELYIFTTGVTLGFSQRNFTVKGCLVGKDVYETERYAEEILRCQIPRPIEKGELISAVLLNDNVLKTAGKGPVTLKGGLVAKLDKGDIEPLDKITRMHGKLSTKSPQQFRRIRSYSQHSNLVERVAPQEAHKGPRYRLCLMTQIKPFTDMLEEWVAYYRRIGVDKVFIFDNGADDDLQKMFANREDVEVVFWPWQTSQGQSFSFFLLSSSARCEWTMFCDVDEYVMFGIEENNSFTREMLPFRRHISMVEEEGYPQYRFLYLQMGNSGYVQRPNKPVVEAYTHRFEPQKGMNGKSVCMSDVDWRMSNIHSCSQMKWTVSWRETRREFYPKRAVDAPSIVHYQFRGFKDSVQKAKAGRQALAMEWNREREERRRTGNVGPAKAWTMIDNENLRFWDHFRVIWRQIMAKLALADRMIVTQRDGLKCVKYRGATDWNGEESCLKTEKVKLRQSSNRKA